MNMTFDDYKKLVGELKEENKQLKEKLEDSLNQIGFMHKKLEKIEEWYKKSQYTFAGEWFVKAEELKEILEKLK